MEVAKTPSNVLKAFCAKKNWTADYQIVSEEGRVHEPTFTFRVFIAEICHESIAAGFSKKKAKQAAALKALQSLAETDEEAKAELATVEDASLNELETSVATEKSNPVGKLQEVCMRKKWSPPIYSMDEEDGQPHCKLFTITCVLENLDLESQGQDKSKKSGKKIAAQEMLNLLEKKGLYDAQADSVKTGKYAIVFKGEDSNCDKIVNFFRKIADPVHRKLDEIIAIIDGVDEPSECDYVSALNQASSIIEIKNKLIEFTNSLSGDFHVVIQLRAESLKDLPIATGYGTDKDVAKAKQKAAFTALTLLDKVRYI